jgi:hypothetical protein
VSLPVLELRVGPGTAEELGPLVRSLGPWCRPLAPEAGVEPAVRLLSSPTAPGARHAARDGARPYAVVVRDQAELEHPVSRGAAALVTIGRGLAGLDDRRAVALPPVGIDAAALLPVPVFVRARWRRRLGLPDGLVLTIGRPGAPELDPSARIAGLRLAAVVDATGPAAVEALALGAPVVTDGPTAALIGARDGKEVLVAPARSSAEAAAGLAADADRATVLAAAGRRLVESSHDLGRVAGLLARALGLPEPGWRPADVATRLATRAEGLGTPPGDPLIGRLLARLELGVDRPAASRS